MEPLPPVKEVEYRCVINKAFDEISGMEYTTFSFETAKEFSSFRYEIAVRYKLEPGTIIFRVLGMTATRMMMPSFGTAKSVLKVPHLPYGSYTVNFVKSDGAENQFFLEFSKKGVQILKPIPRKRFIDLIIDPHAAMQGKILSTVTKIISEPLVPRTIQKRLPLPPTAEELEILESLRSETPEERDAREEMELFGGKKKISKKDLAESEKELRKLGDKPAAKKVTNGKPKKNGASKKATVSKSTSKPAAKKAVKPAKKAAVKNNKPKAKPLKKKKK
jgi:hypothetical protein